jgi:hypothetical protein
MCARERGFGVELRESWTRRKRRIFIPRLKWCFLSRQQNVTVQQTSNATVVASHDSRSETLNASFELLELLDQSHTNDVDNLMLTRRIFQRLTDSILLGRSANSQCFCFILPRNSTSFPFHDVRYSSSSTRWKSRQTKDKYAKEAKVQGLKSRAAFKLLEVRDLECRWMV